MKHLFLLILTAFALAACSTDKYEGPKPPRDANDKYQGGFYVLNEGKYPDPASVNYYDSSTGRWALNIYAANNGGQGLGVTGTVAVFCDQKMYVVAKLAPFLVEIGLSDFVKKTELGSGAVRGQANSFALIDKDRGVLTTTEGAYIVALDPLRLASEPFAAGSFSDVAFTGGHILLIGSGEVKAYDAATLEFVKSLGAAKTGFAKAGGALWAGNGSKLLKINPSALTSEQVALDDGRAVYYNAGAYTPSGMQASKSGEAVYFVDGAGYSGRDICRYVIATGKTERVFAAPDSFNVYGSGLSVNPETGDLYLVYTRSGNYLKTDIYVVGADGVQKKKIPYTTENETQYWFASMIVFR